MISVVQYDKAKIQRGQEHGDDDDEQRYVEEAPEGVRVRGAVESGSVVDDGYHKVMVAAIGC